MTRWARSERSNQKKAHDASSWNDIKQDNVKRVKRDVVFKFGDSANTDVVNPTIADRDSEPQSVIADLEQQGDIHQPSTTRDHSIDVKMKDHKIKRSIKKPSGLLETDLTKQLLKLKQEDDASDFNEIDEIISKDQRREQRRLRRKEKKLEAKTCYNCRRQGHTMEDCLEGKDKEEVANGICYKCGSTEHSVKKCKAKVPAGAYPYAKCFICGEQGHLSKMCSDNPKGLYPRGGCCKLCSSVEHYKKDCPELQNSSGVEEYVVARLSAQDSVDDDSFAVKKSDIKQAPKRKRMKVVNF